MYTIGQVSERTGLPISTLRYYDKEGLFPHMERVSGARRFSERELEALRVIECLKASGLEIRDIRQFMQPGYAAVQVLVLRAGHAGRRGRTHSGHAAGQAAGGGSGAVRPGPRPHAGKDGTERKCGLSGHLLGSWERSGARGRGEMPPRVCLF